MYEKVYNHYHNRKGLEASFTHKALLQTRSHNRDRGALPWKTLMFADQPANFKK